MTSEQWRKIEDLVHAAAGLPAAQRILLLESASPEDRREVELLLAQRIDLPGLPDTSLSTGTIIAAPVPGSLLGPYKIEYSLGQGGMGQVFSALDTRPGRKVAIKVSFEQFTERFEREARAIGLLNHPHICTLYDIGPNYLVMELIDGPTLANRLKSGKLSAEDTMRFGAQAADGLAAAHGRGIIHRDLKPANLMIAKSGVKVLDFGVAKAPDNEPLTAPLMAIGTPAYMAPEQREGKDCDARSDIYSLGLILYEMATGKRLAMGQAPVVDGLPAGLGQIIQGCLEPDPDARWQSAADIRKQLRLAAVPHLSNTNAPSSTPGDATGIRKSSLLASPRFAWIATAISLAVLSVAIVMLFRREAAPEPLPSEFTLSEQQNAGFPVPSPDGSSVVFASHDSKGNTVLWLRRFQSLTSLRLAGTEAADGAVIWSPDGKWICFHAGNKLRKISAAGGDLQTIAEVPKFQDAAWGPRGDIIFRPSNRMPLFRILESGGPVRPLTTLNESLKENSHRYPRFLPDGKHFLFVSRCGERSNDALYEGSLDSAEVKRLMPMQSQAFYMPPRQRRPGTLVYYRDGAVVAQPFDIENGKAAGAAVTLIDGVGYNSGSMRGAFAVSADARLILTASQGSGASRLIWYKRDGAEAGSVGGPGQYILPRLSPAGDRLVFSLPDPQTGNRDLGVVELARGIQSRLTTNVANDFYPVWSPDGRRIVFGSDRDGGTATLGYLKKSMDPGSDEARLVGVQTPFDWSGDGRWISHGDGDISITPVAGGASFAFLATPAWETDARFSPDVKWIAYSSNESGRQEIYARPFAGKPATPGDKVQISNNGGEYPVWGPGGREIYFMSPDASIVSVDTRGLGHDGAIPSPAPLFRACSGTGPIGRPGSGAPYLYSFDTRDGQRFLVVCGTEAPGKFTVLTNPKF